MKLLHVMLIIIGTVCRIQSQDSSIIYDKDSIDYIYVFDSDTLKQLNYGYYKPRFHDKRSRLLWLNSQALDSIGIRFSSNPTVFENHLIGPFTNYDDVRAIVNYDVSNQKINIDYNPIVQLNNSQYPYAMKYQSNTQSTILASIKDGVISEVADLSSVLGVQEPPGIPEEVQKIILLSDENLLVETAYCDGGCYWFNYHKVVAGQVVEESFNEFRLAGLYQVSNESDFFRINFYFSHSDRDFLLAGINYSKLPPNTDLIFSKDLADTTHIIKKHESWEIIGENIQQSMNQFFYMRSRLDNGEKVIVRNRIDKRFEKIAYQIFTDQLLPKDRFKDFDEEQLGILKNFVFAKHNYAFNSDFYQAYFNLFDFYNNEAKRATRTKNMEGLLTKADLQNLEIINKALKKFE